MKENKKGCYTYMKRLNLGFLLIILLIVPSTLIYLLHYFIFKDSQYLLKDFISQLAFLPIYYLFTTLIIDNIWTRKEKLELNRKINMLIGVFFSEFGNEFIIFFQEFDTKFCEFSKKLLIDDTWSENKFSKASQFINTFDFNVDIRNSDSNKLKRFLELKHSFLVSMLENQNILEHDTFTELMLAVFHLSEELKFRSSLQDSPPTDLNHISLDMKRAYKLLVFEWLNYIRHIKSEYPYLYSLSIRKNPFLKENNIIIY